MRRIASIVALALASALFAHSAAAQCIWGCTCVGRACGCNSNGSGSRCDTGGTGCMVTMCDSEQGPVTLGADGSAVRLAALASPLARLALPLSLMPVAVQSRWEYRGPGRSVARHCSGVVVARYFDRTAAAAVRHRQRTLTV